MRGRAILRVRGVLLVSLEGDLHDAGVADLQEAILCALEGAPARGVVVDLTGIELVDTYTARAVAQTAHMARLMGARTIVTGMRPEIALTLTDMGFAASGFEAALDLDDALARLERGS
ncbi:MAG: STAS domain-containing protein [Planctomycetes bacterium]|nr:STAS domain-containing protein [Planctomycetota bacterium]